MTDQTSTTYTAADAFKATVAMFVEGKEAFAAIDAAKVASQPAPSIRSLRRRAAKLGYAVRKSNWRRGTELNLGGYQIIDTAKNLVVEGVTFDLELDYVESFIADLEGDE